MNVDDRLQMDTVYDRFRRLSSKNNNGIVDRFTDVTPCNETESALRDADI